MFDLNLYRPRFEEALEHFKNDIAGLRTGRATPALVNNCVIEAYGSKSPLVQLASVSVSDARTLTIQPWDKGILKDIERSLSLADLNCQPVIDGAIIRLSLPPMTEENRKMMVRQLRERAEGARVTLRQLRERVRTDVSTAFDDGSVAEDEKFKVQKHVDEMVKEYNDKISDLTDQKEQEIMTI